MEREREIERKEEKEERRRRKEYEEESRQRREERKPRRRRQQQEPEGDRIDSLTNHSAGSLNVSGGGGSCIARSLTHDSATTVAWTPASTLAGGGGGTFGDASQHSLASSFKSMSSLNSNADSLSATSAISQGAGSTTGGGAVRRKNNNSTSTRSGRRRLVVKSNSISN